LPSLDACRRKKPRPRREKEGGRGGDHPYSAFHAVPAPKLVRSLLQKIEERKTKEKSLFSNRRKEREKENPYSA